jgi:hypothetical protein
METLGCVRAGQWGTDADEEDEDEEHAQHGDERRGEGGDDGAEARDAPDDPEDPDGLQAGGEARRPAGGEGEGGGGGDDEGVEEVPGVADEGAVPVGEGIDGEVEREGGDEEEVQAVEEGGERRVRVWGRGRGDLGVDDGGGEVLRVISARGGLEWSEMVTMRQAVTSDAREQTCCGRRALIGFDQG